MVAPGPSQPGLEPGVKGVAVKKKQFLGACQRPKLPGAQVLWYHLNALLKYLGGATAILFGNSIENIPFQLGYLLPACIVFSTFLF